MSVPTGIIEPTAEVVEPSMPTKPATTAKVKFTEGNDLNRHLAAIPPARVSPQLALGCRKRWWLGQMA